MKKLLTFAFLMTVSFATQAVQVGLNCKHGDELNYFRYYYVKLDTGEMEALITYAYDPFRGLLSKGEKRGVDVKVKVLEFADNFYFLNSYNSIGIPGVKVSRENTEKSQVYVGLWLPFLCEFTTYEQIDVLINVIKEKAERKKQEQLSKRKF